MSSFPLLRLPFVVQREVIRIMHPYELVPLSVVSKRSRRLVESAHLKATRVIVRIESYITAKITISFNDYQKYTWEVHIPEAYSISYNNRRNKKKKKEKQECRKPGYELGDWIDLLLTVTHHQNLIDVLSITGILLPENPNFIQRIRNDFNGCKVNNLRVSGFDENQSFEICKAFLPNKRLYLQTGIFKREEEFVNVLNQNYDVLLFEGVFRRWEITPENFMNSRYIRIMFSREYNRGFNEFLLKWKYSEAGLLEHVNFNWRYGVEIVKDEVLSGLGAKEVEEERVYKKKFQFWKTEPTEVVIKEGFDIERIDGTIGTVLFHINQFLLQRVKIEFFVWPRVVV
ncbi:hypothetical protein CRE_23058 [Caenorhabditis remanei]|uniref:Uncharacterized protein n=1 Tax=Caenorhabditis remanei TaxID=31234 RepID=E3N9G0_CAERE|nr:hypothetical protein CRE_23058 [Caenorhabditis remanei]